MPAQSLKLSHNVESSSQAVLFSDEDFQQRLLDREAKGEYTAERLRLRDPVKYLRIGELLGLGWGQKRIAKFLNVHHRTVAAVDAAEPRTIDTVQGQFARDLRRACHLQAERLNEHPDLVPMQMAGMVISQLTPIVELIEGRATARVEHHERVDIYSDWQEFVEKKLQADDVVEIGLAVGKVSPIGNGDAELGVSGDLTQTDMESDVSQHATMVDTTTVATPVAVKPLEQSNSERPSTSLTERGRGGDPQGHGGPEGSTHKGADKIFDNGSA